MSLYANNLVIKYELENVDDPSKPKQVSQKIRVGKASTVDEMKILAEALKELIDTFGTTNYQEAITEIV